MSYRNENDLGFFFNESASDRTRNQTQFRSSFANYQEAGEAKSFDQAFQDLYEQYKESSYDIKRDIENMMSDRAFMEQYKMDLMGPVVEAFREASPNDPHIESIIENAEKFWDNKIKVYNETAAVAAYLPISTLEFPVLVKQFYSSILKDIIEVETVKSPILTKHVRTTYLVDNNTGEEYEYPKCLFNGEWEKIWNAAKGHKIKEEVVSLNDGRLWKYDIIGNLTDGTPGLDKLSFQFKIIAIEVDGEVITLPGNAITVELSTNGTLLNGDLDFDHEGTHINDTLSGQVDFNNGTISMSSASGQVTGVVFSGYLSNEKNLRSVSVREARRSMRFQIEDGARWNMPFSIEEIEDAAALLDINYYNRMVNEVVKTEEMNECMTVIKFLNDEYAKYNGMSPDIYKLESLSQTFTVDIEPPKGIFAGDPFDYIAKAIQFRLKAIIHQLSELTKMNDLSFIIVGNPMACQLIAKFTEWKTQQGTSVGGINVNGSYGFATDMGASIRVVSTNLYDAYTKDPDDVTNERELVLHIYGYPTDDEHISFKHLKYTSHILTSQSQSAYQSQQAPGGAYNIVTAVSRFKDISVQGIQARLIIQHSNTVYGKAPAATPITGAPWTN